MWFKWLIMKLKNKQFEISKQLLIFLKKKSQNNYHCFSKKKS